MDSAPRPPGIQHHQSCCTFHLRGVCAPSSAPYDADPPPHLVSQWAWQRHHARTVTSSMISRNHYERSRLRGSPCNGLRGTTFMARPNWLVFDDAGDDIDRTENGRLPMFNSSEEGAGPILSCSDVEGELAVLENVIRNPDFNDFLLKAELCQDDATKNFCDPTDTSVSRTGSALEETSVSACDKECLSITDAFIEEVLGEETRNASGSSEEQHRCVIGAHNDVGPVEKLPRRQRHQCAICKRSFKGACDLRVHQRIHTGDRPHCCFLCGKSFVQKGQLTVHLRTHTGAKPYRCDICKMSFAYQTSFIVHSRTHRGDKCFQCDVCEKSYKQKNGLARHRRTHERNNSRNPRKCELCGQSFAASESLGTHDCLDGWDQL